MRWPIRNQILVPFAGLQVVAVALLSVSAAFFVVRRMEEETAGRLNHVIGTLQSSRFPVTDNVLQQMRGLSGADFVVIDSGRRIQAATLTIPAGSVRSLSEMSVPADAVTLDAASRIELSGRRYFAARVNVRGAEGPATLLALYPEDRWRRARSEAIAVPLTIGGLTIAAMVGVSVWLSSRFGRRMRTIQNQVARIADGEFEPINLDRRGDEIRDLSMSVNQMSQALQATTAAIRKSERDALFRQLAGGLAHQIRNAITGARMAIQLHLRRCVQGDEESLAVALRQLSFTEEQIKGLLRVARDDRRDRVPGELSEVVDDVVSLVGPFCEHEQVHLETRDATVGARVTDTDAMRTALLNLVLNAIEAAGPRGHVELSVTAERDGVTIEVSDDGPGVPAEVERTLFDPFVTTKPEGVGLGLVLACQSTREQGGSLAHDRRDGRTVFTLSLPSRRGDDRPPSAEGPGDGAWEETSAFSDQLPASITGRTVAEQCNLTAES